MKKIIPNPSPKTNKIALFVLGLEFGIIIFIVKLSCLF
jgi:hypothetical protein